MPTGYYLHEIHPNHRDSFTALMKLRGIEGTRKLKGRVGTNDRIITSLEDNLHFEFPEGQYLEANGDSSRVYHDTFIEQANNSGVKTKIQTKRGYEYYTLQIVREAGREYARAKSRIVRRIYSAGYGNVVTLKDLESLDTFREWMNNNANNSDHRYYERKPCYVHALLIEGVHFNTDKASQLNGKFVEMELVVPTKNEQEAAPVTKSNKYGRRVSPPKVPKLAAKPSGFVPPSVTKHGYLVLGHYVITTFPGHAQWLESLPVVEVTEDTMLTKWRNVILGDIVTQKQTIEEKREKLSTQILECERKLGQLMLLERAARENTNKAIRDNIERLRAIPELESLTLTTFGFTAITNDMMAYRQSNGDERYCGRFEIQVSLHGKARARNIASPKEGWRNPHGSCKGSFGTIFGSALRTFDYNALILAIMEYYRMVDEDHDHKFDDLPDSKGPPKKTWVSPWQEIVGTAWEEDNESDSAFEQETFTGYRDTDMEDDEEEDY